MNSAGKSWTEQAKLEAGGEIGERPLFGSSLALSGNGSTALIGGECESTVRKRPPVRRRRVGLYPLGGNMVSAGRKARPERTNGRSSCGDTWRSGENGNTGLVGAYGDIASWVFTRSGVSWAQQGKAGRRRQCRPQRKREHGADRPVDGPGSANANSTGTRKEKARCCSRAQVKRGAPAKCCRRAASHRENRAPAARSPSGTGETALVGAPGAEGGTAVVFQTPPVVVTGSATEVTTSTATVAGIVNPGTEDLGKLQVRNTGPPRRMARASSARRVPGKATESWCPSRRR